MSQRTRWGFDRSAGAKHRPAKLVRAVRFPAIKPAPAVEPGKLVYEHLGVMFAVPAPCRIDLQLGPGGNNHVPAQEIKRKVRAPSQAPRRAVIGQRHEAEAPSITSADPVVMPDPPPPPAPPAPRKMKIRQSDIPSAMETLAASWGKASQ